MLRNVNRIQDAMKTRMGEIVLHQAFPLKNLEQISPFILLHHFDFQIEAGDNSFYVPPHPHRGFCPVTYMFDGSILHRDSKGNVREIHEYEVQWITAGKGIVHSESLSPEFVRKGGRFQGIQLWINLPARRKMFSASYQPIGKDEIVLIEGDRTRIHLVSGQMMNKLGAAHSSDITAMVEMKTRGQHTFNLPAEDNVILYILEGELKVNNEHIVQRQQFISFNTEGGDIHCSAQSDIKMLLMSGRPLNEPMATDGPFVMNTQAEVEQAMRDYHAGNMGYLYA